MRRNILVISLLLLIFTLAAGCGNSAGGKVLVVDTQRIFTESEPAKAGVAYLEGMSKDIQAELMALQMAVEKAEDKDKDEAQFKLQTRLRDAQQTFQSEQQRVMFMIQDLYRQVLADYAAKSNVDMVLDSEMALFHAPTADITDSVIAGMNQKTLSFTPDKEADNKPDDKDAAQVEKEQTPPAEADKQ